MKNEIKKVSFATGGFCFHLTQKNDTLYTDQTGGEWVRTGLVFASLGGSYIYKLKESDIAGTGLSNKEFFGELRRNHVFDKSRDRHYLDRFEYIHK